MKIRGFTLIGLLVLGIGLKGVPAAKAQAPAGETFPGVKKTLTPAQFTAAGLGKLSPEEQGRLDEFLRDYFNGASQRVAEQAVDRAVKEKKVEPAAVIESHIVGTFRGWTERTVFLLDNGQRWKPVSAGSASFPPVENPQVFIVRDMFGSKMAILGGSVLRVRRL